MTTTKKVIIPEDMGKTIEFGHLETDKWNVKPQECVWMPNLNTGEFGLAQNGMTCFYGVGYMPGLPRDLMAQDVIKQPAVASVEEFKNQKVYKEGSVTDTAFSYLDTDRPASFKHANTSIAIPEWSGYQIVTGQGIFQYIVSDGGYGNNAHKGRHVAWSRMNNLGMESLATGARPDLFKSYTWLADGNGGNFEDHWSDWVRETAMEGSSTANSEYPKMTVIDELENLVKIEYGNNLVKLSGKVNINIPDNSADYTTGASRAFGDLSEPLRKAGITFTTLISKQLMVVNSTVFPTHKPKPIDDLHSIEWKDYGNNTDFVVSKLFAVREAYNDRIQVMFELEGVV